MNTNLENKPNKVGEVRKQLQDSIAEECRKIVNMTNADFEKEYENHELDSLRVICALYGIDPVELMKILCDHSARQSIKTLEAEFEQIYNEPLWIDEPKQQFPTTGDVPEMTPITEKTPEMVTEFADFK